MTDEERKALVERLRDGRWKGETTCGPAADQIEADGKRIAELEAALRAEREPHWFYAEGSPEYCCWSPWEVIEEQYDPEPGEHVFEVTCAKPVPSIWCAVKVTDDPEADQRFTFTEHATEAEARAALGDKK